MDCPWSSCRRPRDDCREGAEALNTPPPPPPHYLARPLSGGSGFFRALANRARIDESAPPPLSGTMCRPPPYRPACAPLRAPPARGSSPTHPPPAVARHHAPRKSAPAEPSPTAPANQAGASPEPSPQLSGLFSGPLWLSGLFSAAPAPRSLPITALMTSPRT